MDRKEYFQGIEKKQRIYLNNILPLVIRIDGKDVTKNHEKYNLLDRNGFTKDIYFTAINLFKDYACEIYAGLDEVDIIIYESSKFFGMFEDTNQIYAAGIIIQEFTKNLPNKYPDTLFGISMFNIPTKMISHYIKYRKKIIRDNSIVYYAKEHMHKDFYHNLSTEQILQNMKNQNIYNDFEKETWFYNGLQRSAKLD